jgi:gamma-glutamylcyclotransferase (GGCT)/AIG2-like uncharacterized protein YtfP
MGYVVVYGTLKKGGSLAHYMSNSRFVRPVKIPGFVMYDFGSFPGIYPNKYRQNIYGELWEINESVLQNLDACENEGYLYKRDSIKIDKKINAWIYISNYMAIDTQTKFKECNFGYWLNPGKIWKIMRVNDDRKRILKGTAKKIVFDMRFFDTSAGRCTTNKEYMELVAHRMFTNELNTHLEDVFLTDLILYNKLKELP